MNDSKMTPGIGLMAIVAILLTPFLIALHGFVFMKLFGWFVVEPFGVPHISLWQAAGLSMVMYFPVENRLTNIHKDAAKTKLTPGRIAEAITTAVLAPLMTLGIGALIHYLAR